MSEKLCTLRTKGGGGAKYTETSLWTNPSPSSSFAAQTITLSDDITKYTYIKVCYRTNTGSTTDYSVVFPLDIIQKSSTTAGYPVCEIASITTSTPLSGYVRAILYAGTTNQLTIDTSTKGGASGTNNAMNIPTQILGLNELAQGKTNQTVLWTNSSPTSSFAAQTISLDLSEYDAIILKCSSMTTNTLPAAYPTNTCSQQYLSVPYGVAGTGGSGYRISYGIGVESSNSFNSNRETIVTTSGVTFGGGYRNYSAGNQYAIPIQIIGVKIS